MKTNTKIQCMGAVAALMIAPLAFADNEKAVLSKTATLVEARSAEVSEKESREISGVAGKNFKLGLVDKVRTAGSDERSEKFQEGVLPGLKEVLGKSLSEGQKLDDSLHRLDPSKLFLSTAVDARVYFVGEGAGYANTLGVNTEGIGVQDGDPAILFPNASSNGYKRTESEPLLPGDFVDLGKIEGGKRLDFFLIADGAKGGKSVFTTEASANPDKINHVITFATVYGSYLILGFEDILGGGDRDFNDVLFAVDLGSVNIAALTGTPEPATYATMGLFLAGGVWAMRRRRAGK